MPSPMRSLVLRKLKNTRRYEEDLRSFAISLIFYSRKAYIYGRSKLKNLLPHPDTIKKWYTVIDGSPGFTEEALMSIKERCREKTVFVNICIDEMSIREQLIFLKNKFIGSVTFNANVECTDNDNPILAKSALIFMAVGINDNWKVPIGYFLIKSLTGEERANLLKTALLLMEDTGAIVRSITFDGAPVNLKMCRKLGANFNLTSFKPYFKHPNNTDNVYIFIDICHNIKLVRNTFGDKQNLFCGENTIRWELINHLYNRQCEEGLRPATKLTKQHVQ